MSKSPPRLTAGELSKKALSDNTKYDALEVGHAITDDMDHQIRLCIENHKAIIDENEFCIVMIISKDPMLHNLIRRKFYAWPYLPKPRPNHAVFLYNKSLDAITHRLWVLPSDVVMAELHSLHHVDTRYKTMKRWSDAFYKGWKYDKKTKSFFNSDPFYFWNYVRQDQKIEMLSEHEYFLQHREELIKAGCQLPDSDDSEAFDFSKIQVNEFVNPVTAVGE